MSKRVYNNSRSPSFSRSSSSLSDDESLHGDVDHDQHHQLARHVWDHYTSSSELGKRVAPGDDDEMPSKLSEEDRKKTELTSGDAGNSKDH